MHAGTTTTGDEPQASMNTQSEALTALRRVFSCQQATFAQCPFPAFKQRRAALLHLKQVLLDEHQLLVEALAADYGHRSTDESRITDILPLINQINYSLSRLKRWMRPSRRRAGFALAPARVRVQYQPKGVIGIIAPWNFPVMLSLGPLVTAIAAGNLAMIKLSEFTPYTNAVLKRLLAKVFSQDSVCVIEGDAQVAAAFAALPFDHLLFTGASNIGREVMRAASDNLTPVTLELGGKSPLLIAPDMDIRTAVERLIYGKCLNAGQICVAPDYVMLPQGRQDEFIRAYRAQFAALYGKVATNPDYSAIINSHHWQRLMALLDDALAKGALIHCASGEGPLPDNRKLPTQIITQTSDDMRLMQEEIFGPLLPLVPYQTLNQAIDYINNRPRPLALYLMSFDRDTQERLIASTHSGGVCINETLLQVAADDAPFGGIGASGMGHYHGGEGFRAFSHAKTVLTCGRLDSSSLLRPPYGKSIHKLLMKLLLR